MIEYNAIVLAAGKGKRMEAGENKQFINLDGKPLIIHTLTVFEKDPWCKSMVLVTNQLERERMEQLLDNYPFHKRVIMVDGGNERQDSVLQGLRAVKEQSGIVFIHDGARPFVQQDRLHELAEVAKEKKAALLAVPVKDTIKKVDGDKLTTLDRSVLWAAQTPQAFQFEVVYRAHEEARKKGFIGTDDASLVEKIGLSVTIVEGNYTNIKLTTPEDIEQANSIINSQSVNRD